MSSAASEFGRVLDDYRASVASLRLGPAHTPAVDELLRPGLPESIRESLVATIDGLGYTGLQVARAETRRFVHDDGITYGSTSGGFQGRNWILDPLPVVLGEQEWASLERALRQRTHLLNLILTDVYGERRLLHDRVLPPEIILGNPEFIRQADGVRLPGANQLILASTDLARDSDGTWRPYSDRTQAPSGAGYAMANRRIVSRVMAGLHRHTNLARLRGFFHTMGAALTGIAPDLDDQPRAVLLSPGPNSETAFDQAFMATLLGIPLVESDDLTSREGRIWLRATDRLDPVDVIVRRVDSQWVDPLELRAESRLGLPGLIDAARNTRVAVANPIGSGVLESPALLAHLGKLSRYYLGEDLLLESCQTWWCGDDGQREHVLAHLGELVIRPTDRSSMRTSVAGWQLSRERLSELADRIRAEPSRWCAQEPLPNSTAPTVTRNGLEPRRMVLRTFGVAHEGRYHFMPGGLARVGADADQHVISNQSGALAKDVWVLGADTQEADVSQVVRSSIRHRLSLTQMHPNVGMVPRVSDNLFWLGRYAERAEATARLLAVADDLVEDYGNRPGTPGESAMRAVLGAVTEATTTFPGFVGAGREERIERPLEHLRSLVIDDARSGTIAHAVSRLVQCAQQVRDQLSLDSWIVLSRMERTLAEIPPDEAQLQPQLARLLESLLAWSGIMADGMVRDQAWAFVDAGGRLERALQTVTLLKASIGYERAPVVDGQVTEATLQAGVSIITHRRRASFGTGPVEPAESAADLLLLDRSNPRSVAYQLERLTEDLALIGDRELSSVPRDLGTRLRALNAEALCANERYELNTLLTSLADDLRGFGDRLAGRHFTRKPSQRAVVPSWDLEEAL